MARSRRSAKLDTRNARRRLPTAQNHMEPISKGQYLVYRKPKSGAAGSWSACFANLETKKQKRTHIGTADDFQDANGKTILAYAQAQAKAMQWFKAMERQIIIEADGDIVPEGLFTVANALEAYCQDRIMRGNKGIYKTKLNIKAWIIPCLGNIPVSKLTRIRIEKWLDEMANTPKRLRTKIGQEQTYAPPAVTDDEKRARKATANKNLAVLKAALTFAIDRRLADAPERPWQLVKLYRGTTKARIRFLTQEEQVRLVNVCPPEFKALVRGALLTGCRYGELARLRVKDYDPENGSIFIADSKSGKPRHVYLAEEGKALFDELTAKPDTESLIFTNSRRRIARTSGEKGAWMQSDAQELMRNACKAAGIEPLTFHELRHTYASMLVNRGCMLSVVAKLLGHADTRMVETHYGHLTPNTVKNELLKTMPTLGILEPAKVQKLRIAGN